MFAEIHILQQIRVKHPENFQCIFVVDLLQHFIGKMDTIYHPPGLAMMASTGCRIVVSLIHELEKRGLNRGLASLCGGGGHGQAIIIERVE